MEMVICLISAMRSPATIALQHSGGIQGNEQEIFFSFGQIKNTVTEKVFNRCRLPSTCF
jgi:hypothetical protein